MENIKRPKTRKFWALLKVLPQGVRAHYLRRQFEVTANLPEDLILKQAETEDEIKQALHLVYESYLSLDYIDPNSAEIRLTKYHLLPTTIILIAKRQNEVIGTMSIIMDSPLKLPSDMSWDLSALRKGGKQIAEISSLTIKKNSLSRGKLLLPLCKLMHEYCNSLLKLDGIVASTNADVEPFYTDLLMFKRIDKNAVRPNPTVKGAVSTCCYLGLKNLEEKYEEIYNDKADRFNLFKFFVKTRMKNIQLPTQQQCLQSYTVRQTLSHAKILESFPEICKTFTDQDRKVISNLDISNRLQFQDKSISKAEIQPRTYRYEIRQKAWCYLSSIDRIVSVTLLNLSESGFRVVLHEDNIEMDREKSIFVFFTVQDKVFQFHGRWVWSGEGGKIGCSVDIKSQDWLNYHSFISKDFLNKETG